MCLYVNPLGTYRYVRRINMPFYTRRIRCSSYMILQRLYYNTIFSGMNYLLPLYPKALFSSRNFMPQQLLSFRIALVYTLVCVTSSLCGRPAVATAVDFYVC